jgi:hypothetical protein
MLRTLLVMLAAGLCLNVQAQTAVQKLPTNTTKATKANIKPQGLTNKVKVVSGNESAQANANVHPAPAAATNSSSQRSVGTVIGTTYYDLQSNYGMGRRVWNDNGTIHAVWTRSNANDAAWADRGTGLNTSTDGGATWGPAPTARIEGTERCGWPTIGITATGRKFVTTHTGAKGLLFTYQDAGSTTWTKKYVGEEQGDLTGVWNRATVSGNNIHVIISRQDEFDGMVGGLAYFHSADGGDTWTGPTVIADAAGESLIARHMPSVNADAYFIDSKGDHVVFVTGEYSRQVVMYESMDNGATWTDRVIKSTSNPLFPDAPTDEDDLDPAAVSGGGQTIIIDANDVVHVWYDRVFTYDDAGDGQVGPFYLPNSSCIMYWNSNMTTDPIVLGKTVRQDLNQDGTTALDTQVDETQSYGVSIVGQPSGGIDAQGNLYVAYSSANDGEIQANHVGTESQRIYRDVYMIKSTDGGATWVGPYNVTNTPTKEEVYPSISRLVDGTVHLIYQEDDSTGTALQNTTGTGQAANTVNNIVYVGVPVGDIVNPSPIVDTNPEINYLSVPYAIQGCPVTADRFDAHSLDYPDGELPIAVGGTVNVAVPNDTGDGYYWLLTSSDSDGNTTTQDFIDTNTGTDAAIIVYTDETPPDVFGGPFTYDDLGQPLETLFGFFSEVDVLQNTTYNDYGAIVFDDADTFGCPAVLTTDNPVNTATLGNYTVTYNAVDNVGNAAEPVTRAVNVIGADVDAPVIYVYNADSSDVYADGTVLDLQADPGGDYTVPGHTTADNVDGLLTANTTVTSNVDLSTPGTYTVVYTATDAAGNTSTLTLTVTVADTQAPIITLGGPSTIVWSQCDVVFTDPAGTTAFDAVDGNLTSSIVVTGTVNTSCGGSYTRTYTVTDAAGNVATVTRTVIVSATCTGNCGFPIGLNNVEVLNGVSVYPNPVQGIVNIAIPNVSGKVTVTIYNAAGAVVRNIEQNLNKGGVISTDLSNVAAGTYVATITAAEGTTTQRFVVSK